MSRLSTGLSSTCDAPTAFTLSAGEAVRRWRLGRGRRILLSQRELPFEIGDPLLLLRILLSESFVFTPQPLELVCLTRRLIGIGTRLRRPVSRRHARYGTPIGSTCTDP
jgi:hypothetical protein